MCAHRGLLSSYKSEGIKMVDAITHGLVEVLSNDSQTHNTSKTPEFLKNQYKF